MRTFMAWPILIACLATSAISPLASAQNPTPAGQLYLEPLNDEVDSNTLTAAPGARHSGSTETRLPGGRVTEIEVKSGGSTYYLKPQSPTGATRPGNAQDGTGRPVQWNVLNFDLPRPARATLDDVPASAPVPPPPRAN